jgi:hypothetical protein
MVLYGIQQLSELCAKSCGIHEHQELLALLQSEIVEMRYQNTKDGNTPD